MSEEKDIELRSEELQEVLGAVPHWILRRGVAILGLAVLIIIAGSVVFKYPDTIAAEITLTGTTPPAGIVAKVSGKLDELLVDDNQMVVENEWLAVIENPINTKDILYLKSLIAVLKIDEIATLPRKDLRLGNIQSLYSAFFSNLHDFIEFNRINYYPSKIKMAKERILQYEKQYERLVYQSGLVEKQLAISKKQFERDSLLFKTKAGSLLEFETAQNQYLQACISYENMCTSISNMQLQIKQTEESLYDLEQQYTEKKNNFTGQLLNNISQINAEIHSWEMNYVLSSPISGKITFTKFWVKNQNIVGGETVFTVVPSEEPELIGKATMPIARSGKVRPGQKINIRFDNFPDAEFGTIKGVVKNISLIPAQVDNTYCYTVEIVFPQGLLTTYGKTLPFLPDMKGQADIITDDITVFRRFIMPFRQIWQKGME
ncbi:MAG: HlyD family secretion protein [Bacteroidales bacterium]|nr:HlyD family secretion protein [Bacteroidales bacterium]MCL2133467.1 HlyD family secretion protein [Bacteroidales bacterium]